jgi:RimJ/RimL family protein N-acetyltransferase
MNDGRGPYRVMPRPVLKGRRITVRAVEPEDIEPIRLWRNAQIDVLRQSRPIEKDEQTAYFEREIWPHKTSSEPTNILLSMVENKRLVGYGGLVHIAWDYRRTELSFLLDPAVPRTEEDVADLFLDWVRLMQQFSFEDLGLTRLTTETYAMRSLHIRVLEQAGFLREGLLRQHVRVGGSPMDALVHGCLASDLGQRS